MFPFSHRMFAGYCIDIVTWSCNCLGHSQKRLKVQAGMNVAWCFVIMEDMTKGTIYMYYQLKQSGNSWNCTLILC